LRLQYSTSGFEPISRILLLATFPLDTMTNYLAAPYVQQQQRYGSAAPASKPGRQPSRFNLTAICLCLVLPWLLFSLMYALMSFSLHYEQPAVCYLCVVIGFLVVLMTAKLAFDAVTKQRRDGSADPSWFVFLAVACFVAWMGGVALGDLNYYYNMQPFYVIRTLNSYPSVDPSEMSGQQLMDAGRMTFVSGSKLDLKKSMAFRNLDTYCVAPIVGNMTKGTSYDFWAVGLNCCSGKPGTFGCGEYNNPHALSGLRVMREDQIGFYRLAVHQAEASYNIKAPHPLFFHWMQDPVAEISAYSDEGVKYYFQGVFTFFAILLFTIVVALVVFSKMA